jgi:hypothetical protein
LIERNAGIFASSCITRELTTLQLGLSVGEQPCQGLEPWQEEIGAATDRDELRQRCGEAAGTTGLRAGESIGWLTAREGLAITQYGVLLVGHACELCVGQPGTLDKLELPREIRVQAYEAQTGLHRID